MKKQEIWGASMGMFQSCSLLIYSKQETWIHEWKLEDNNKARDTIPFYQVMESINNPSSFIQEHPRGNPKARDKYFFQRLYDHILLLSSILALFTMKTFGIYRLKWGQPHGSTCSPIGLIKISKLVLEALQSPRHKNIS